MTLQDLLFRIPGFDSGCRELLSNHDNGDGPFASVIVRTTGERESDLRNALGSLAKQTDRDFEVLVVIHREEGSRTPFIRSLGEQILGPVRVPVAVMRVTAGERGRPLNVGIERAVGSYVAFLDEDDIVEPSWMAVFKQGARDSPGRIIRSVVVDRPVRRPAHGSPETTGPDRIPAGRREFDLLSTFTRSQTPISAIAVPRRIIATLDLRFSDDLEALEDFEFLIRAASLIGVHDTGEVTAIYHRWESGEASYESIGSERWESLRREVFERLDRAPLLLPEGSVTRIVDLYERAQQNNDRKNEIRRLRKRIDEIEASTSWKVTSPIRRVMDWIRKEVRGH